MTPNTPAHALLELYEDFGRQVSAATGTAGVMQAVTEVTARAVPGADFASITRRKTGSFETSASTDERANRADELQYRLLSGPCVDAVEDDHIFIVQDVGTDPRWPRFGRLAVRTAGVHSIFSIRLRLDEDQIMAGLNVYGERPGAFGDDSVAIATLLAAHASAAVTTALARERARNLEIALETNREIGVAIGVLMFRYKITREQGFDLLRVASQHTHRKLRDLAKDVADTGELELPPPHGSGRLTSEPSIETVTAANGILR